MPARSSVFVVDDDPSMRTGIKRLLRVHGFHSTLFESASALLACGDFDKAFCFILDINLNGESGIELCGRLADRGVSLPVIYITGNDSEANRAGAIGLRRQDRPRQRGRVLLSAARRPVLKCRPPWVESRYV